MEVNRRTLVLLSSPKTVLIMLAVLLLLVGGIIGAAWYGMSHVPLTAARIWAALATVALPLTAWSFYRLGHSNSEAELSGIDKGIEKVAKAQALVTDAATRSIDLRGQAARQQPMAVEPAIELPRLDAHYHVMEALPAGETVEME